MQHYTFKTLLSEQIQAESNNKASRPGNIGDIKLNDTMKKKKKSINIGHSKNQCYNCWEINKRLKKLNQMQFINLHWIWFGKTGYVRLFDPLI